MPGGIEARTGAPMWSAARARVTKTGAYVPLVTTEGSARQHGRDIAQAVLATELGAAAPETQEEEGHAIPGAPPHEFLPGLRAPLAADAQGDLVDPQVNEQGMYDPEHWSGMANRRWAMTIDLA